MAQWAETCHRIFNIDYQYIVFIDWINYYIIVNWWLTFFLFSPSSSYNCQALEYIPEILDLSLGHTINCIYWQTSSFLTICSNLYICSLPTSRQADTSAKSSLQEQRTRGGSQRPFHSSESAPFFRTLTSGLVEAARLRFAFRLQLNAEVWTRPLRSAPTHVSVEGPVVYLRYLNRVILSFLSYLLHLNEVIWRFCK